MAPEPFPDDIEQAAAALFPRGSWNFRRARLILQLHVLEEKAWATFHETGDRSYRDAAQHNRQWRQRLVAAGLFDED